jgi:hypothetical protein
VGEKEREKISITKANGRTNLCDPSQAFLIHDLPFVSGVVTTFPGSHSTDNSPELSKLAAQPAAAA